MSTYAEAEAAQTCASPWRGLTKNASYVSSFFNNFADDVAADGVEIPEKAPKEECNVEIEECTPGDEEPFDIDAYFDLKRYTTMLGMASGMVAVLPTAIYA